MGNTLMTNAQLKIGDSLTSPNGQFSLQMQVDSNLVLYNGPPAIATAYWASNTEWLPPDQLPTYATMQADGNLVMFDPTATQRWASGTWGPDFVDPSLTLGDDGNLVIRDKNSQPIWATGRPDGDFAIPARGLVTYANNLDAYIAGLGEPQPVVDIPPKEEGSPEPKPLNASGVEYKAITQKYKTVKGLLQQSYLQDLGAVGVWPGEMIQCKALLAGNVSDVPGARRPGSVNIPTNFVAAHPGPQHRDVSSPDPGTVKDAITSILQAVQPNDSAQMLSSGFQRAYSLQQCFLSAGVHVKGSNFGVDATANLNQTHTQTTVVSVIRQVFYTAEFIPSGPHASGFWTDAVTQAGLAGYVGPGNPPLYIKSVDYGRFIVVLMTGSHSEQELIVAANAQYKSGTTVSGSLDVKNKEIVDSCEVQIYTVGVPGKTGFTTLNDPVSQLNEVYAAGRTFNLANPGAPIAFIAQSVASNTQAAVRVEAEFTKTLSILGVPASGDLQIFDGPGGGPVSSGQRMNPGDTLDVTADGAINTGIVFSGDTKPEGWLGHHANDTYPAPDLVPYSLIGKIGAGSWFKVASECHHVAGDSDDGVEQGLVVFAENDNDPTNGPGADKSWNVHFDIARGGAGAVGLYP
jgi:hypothetical protein